MPADPTTPLFFFFNDTATTEISTLSLHDALPISSVRVKISPDPLIAGILLRTPLDDTDPIARALYLLLPSDDYAKVVGQPDRKSTRLNSSHQIISYAVFCLKKKKHSILTPLSKKE